MRITGRKSSGLAVTTHDNEKAVVITFNDRSLNFYVTDELKDELKTAILTQIEEGYRHVILDFGNVRIIDSAGVGLVVVASNVTSSKNGKLRVCCVKRPIVKIWDLMRITKHLHIFETEEEALAAASQGKLPAD